MTLRLSIDDQSDQIKTPVHSAVKARGCRALPERKPKLLGCNPATGHPHQQPGQVGEAGSNRSR